MTTSPASGPVIDDPIRPRALWYWIGGLVIVASAVGAVAWVISGVLGVDDTVKDFERVPFAGGGTVTLDSSGEYVIYLEPDTAVSSAAVFTLTDPDGDEVDVDVYSTELTYDFGGRSGTAVATFSADQPGDYMLESDSGDSVSIDSYAVGSSIAGDLVSAIAGGFAIGGLGLLVGSVILIVTLARRSRAKRDRRPPSAPSTGWAQPASTWGSPPPSPPGSPPAPPPGTPPAPPPTVPSPPPPGDLPPPPGRAR
jgi:hypothetical protein